MTKTPYIHVDNLTMAYGDHVVQRDLNFEVHRNEIFAIMGGSGCGKSTLMRHMVGLCEPAKGDVYYNGHSFWHTTSQQQEDMAYHFGVMYQGGALWSSMTLLEETFLLSASPISNSSPSKKSFSMCCFARLNMLIKFFSSCLFRRLKYALIF